MCIPNVYQGSNKKTSPPGGNICSIQGNVDNLSSILLTLTLLYLFIGGHSLRETIFVLFDNTTFHFTFLALWPTSSTKFLRIILYVTFAGTDLWHHGMLNDLIATKIDVGWHAHHECPVVSIFPLLNYKKNMGDACHSWTKCLTPSSPLLVPDQTSSIIGCTKSTWH